MTVMMKRSRREVAAAVEALAMANCLVLLASRSEVTNKANSAPSEWDFQCKTCKKRFQSFQALGGHMSSHKRLKSDIAAARKDGGGPEERKRHECPVCGLVYGLGQALGGHMRKHRAEERVRVVQGKKLKNDREECQKPTDKINWDEMGQDKIKGVGLFDLNLLPNDDDDSIEDESVDHTRGLPDFPNTTLNLLI